jgi:hypothetical protein
MRAPAFVRQRGCNNSASAIENLARQSRLVLQISTQRPDNPKIVIAPADSALFCHSGTVRRGSHAPTFMDK